MGGGVGGEGTAAAAAAAALHRPATCHPGRSSAAQGDGRKADETADRGVVVKNAAVKRLQPRRRHERARERASERVSERVSGPSRWTAAAAGRKGRRFLGRPLVVR